MKSVYIKDNNFDLSNPKHSLSHLFHLSELLKVAFKDMNACFQLLKNVNVVEY